LFEASPGKKFARFYLNKRVNMVVWSWHSSYEEKHKEEDHDLGKPRHKVGPYLKITLARNG
jgi:hypothetical protein